MVDGWCGSNEEVGSSGGHPFPTPPLPTPTHTLSATFISTDAFYTTHDVLILNTVSATLIVNF